MNQIKYIIYAFLLFFLIAAGILTILNFNSSRNSKESLPFFHSTENKIQETPVLNSEGKTLFANKCQTCHALDKHLTGPSLREVEKRGPWIDRKNIIKWIKNPVATAAEFEYARKLIENFGGVLMPSFSELTDQQIEAILDYISKSPTPVYNAMAVAQMK